MTREEAIKWLEETIQDTDTYWESCSEALQKELDEQKEVFLLALTALRPVSREQVEKVWRGCRSCKSCRSCVYNICDLKDMPCKKCDPNAEGIVTEYKPSNFCPACGKPLTDEAVQMVIERLEALHEKT